MLKFTLIVMSCDKYSDLWEPFVKCFEHYWPDCPAPVYLVTETQECKNKFFTKTIMCGSDTEWTDRLDYALTQIETDFLIMLCDDYLLCDRVDNNVIQALLDIAKRYDAGNLRMVPSPPPTKIISQKDGIGEYAKSTQYRIATQAGIWRKDYLMQFSNMHTSIWGFERLGSAMSNNFSQPILCVLRHIFPFVDAVHKGKWERPGVSLCERNNIIIDLERRDVMSEKDYTIAHAKGFLISIFPNLVTKGINVVTRLKRAIK